MAKKTKTEKTTAAAPTEPVAEPIAATEMPAPKKAAAKKTTATKSTAKKSAGKKTSAKKAPIKAAAKSSSSAKQVVEPTDEDVRIRAYFIAERRVQMSLGGDPNNDWIQAREELIAELNSNGSASGNGSH